jgi:hypothetical protein
MVKRPARFTFLYMFSLLGCLVWNRTQNKQTFFLLAKYACNFKGVFKNSSLCIN